MKHPVRAPRVLRRGGEQSIDDLVQLAPILGPPRRHEGPTEVAPGAKIIRPELDGPPQKLE